MSLSLKLHRLLVAVRTAANRARIIAWSRVRDDVGLTNQVCALKTGSGIQKSRRAVRLPFQSTFNSLYCVRIAVTTISLFRCPFPPSVSVSIFRFHIPFPSFRVARGMIVSCNKSCVVLVWLR